MKHKKIMHSEYVQSCKNETDGTCQQGSQNCWFNHKETENDANANMNDINIENNYEKKNQNDEIMQKMVEMIEKYSQRIVILENTMVQDIK